MSVNLKIELSDKAKKVLEKLQTLPDWALKAIAAGMDKSNALVLSKIQQKRLTGKGPFPPDEHKLGVVTNRLRGAAWASPAVIMGATVESAIGDNVKYAAIHEFGGVIHFEESQRTIGFKTEKVKGSKERRLKKQPGNSNLLVFAKASDKHAERRDVTIPAHDVIMPERAPFRTGLKENTETYTRIVSAELVSAWKTQTA